MSWFENILPAEIPPEWMWPFPEELDTWWDEVKQAREMGGMSRMEPGEDVPMMSNDLAKDLRG